MRVDSDAALWVETQSAARIRSKVDCVFGIWCRKHMKYKRCFDDQEISTKKRQIFRKIAARMDMSAMPLVGLVPQDQDNYGLRIYSHCDIWH